MLNKKVLWQTIKEMGQSLLYKKAESCCLCGNANGPICPVCEEAFFHPELGRCKHCGKLVPQKQILCLDCSEGRGPKKLDQVAAWGHYTGAWRDFIQTIKFKAQPYLLKEIGYPLANWVIHILPPPDALIPVPMYVERIAERGFNQAAVLASLLHWELGIPLVEGLERKTPTTPQVGLNRYDRLHNLTGAFSISPIGLKWGFKGKRIWLIDDVITTGATMEACADILRRYGAKEVYGLTLAAGMEAKIKE